MAGTLIISLDFELFWGMLDVCPLEKYQDHVLGGRKAIPGLLALFQKYGVHATWATVGYLFARSAQEAASFFPEEGLRPAYDDPALNSYAEFSKIGETEADAPCFFAPSLIELVAGTPGQEIGSHLFPLLLQGKRADGGAVRGGHGRGEGYSREMRLHSDFRGAAPEPVRPGVHSGAAGSGLHRLPGHGKQLD